MPNSCANRRDPVFGDRRIWSIAAWTESMNSGAIESPTSVRKCSNADSMSDSASDRSRTGREAVKSVDQLDAFAQRREILVTGNRAKC